MGTHVAPAPARTHVQARRRERIVRTAAALASRGGIDAMQMRAVAERAGVALGTLYRYFPSKMDLLVAIISEELNLLEASIEHRPPTASAPSARAVDVLMRATRSLMRDPEFAEGVLRAMVFTEGEVGMEFGDRIGRLLLRVAFGVGGDTELDATRLVVCRLLQGVWLSELLGLLRGRRTMAEAESHLRLGAERLLAP
ncbi:MAG: TetR family transcriptional regulator [Streptosporangiaceae bacterium]